MKLAWNVYCSSSKALEENLSNEDDCVIQDFQIGLVGGSEGLSKMPMRAGQVRSGISASPRFQTYSIDN